MYCTKSHIHFEVSLSTSEIFNKNLKIGRFYPGLPKWVIYGSVRNFGVDFEYMTGGWLM